MTAIGQRRPIINCNKRASLVGASITGGVVHAWGTGVHGTPPYFPFTFAMNLTALKHKVYFKNVLF